MIAPAHFAGSESGPYIPASGNVFARALRCVAALVFVLCFALWCFVVRLWDELFVLRLWHGLLIPLFETVILGKSEDEQINK